MDDPGSITRDDVACAIHWEVDDRDVIEVYVDPVLTDRVDGICESVTAIADAHRDIDTLSEAIQTFAEGEDLSASIYDRADDATSGVVAVAFTLG
ncbi:MAG TPA: hypothetical protein VFR93_08120 [Candidatus Limnocylindrales bacterium]|nr:hypothetical protein [Candidatus Limnocylindrales bacterium]